MKRLILTFALAILAGCHSQPVARTLDYKIADAHGSDRWERQDALIGDIHVGFREGSQFDAHFIYELKTGRTRMQLADETVLVFDGQNCWISPATSAVKDARYNLRTWPFLVTLPMQLHAAGSTLSAPESKKVGAIEYDTTTLSFGPSAGDRANDWFMLHADKESHFLKMVACVITRGRALAVAENEAIAITFYNFKPTDGIIFSQDWKFWKYNKTEGIYGLPIGDARVYNLEFYTPRRDTFTPPAGARQEAR